MKKRLLNLEEVAGMLGGLLTQKTSLREETNNETRNLELLSGISKGVR